MLEIAKSTWPHSCVLAKSPDLRCVYMSEDEYLWVYVLLPMIACCTISSYCLLNFKGGDGGPGLPLPVLRRHVPLVVSFGRYLFCQDGSL